MGKIIRNVRYRTEYIINILDMKHYSKLTLEYILLCYICTQVEQFLHNFCFISLPLNLK